MGIPIEVLEEIRSKRMGAKKRSRKIMTAWMEKEIITWEKLVRALDEVGVTSMAYAVAQQYGELCNLFTAINSMSVRLLLQVMCCSDIISDQ